MSLTLPAPEIVTDPPSGPAVIEKPVKVRLSGVRTAAGDPLQPDEVRTIGAFLFRGRLGAEELWDEAANQWIAPAPLDSEAIAQFKPLGLAVEQGSPAVWAGTLVATGPKDAAGAARIAKASAGAPVYRLRAFASAVRAGQQQRGLSPPSPDIAFMSTSDSQRFSIVLDPEDSASTERARLVLRNGSMQPAGYVEIRASGGQEVEIANCDAGGAVRARITLAANGDIRLTPATGRAIVLDGTLEAQRVSYLPQGGGARQSL